MLFDSLFSFKNISTILTYVLNITLWKPITTVKKILEDDLNNIFELIFYLCFGTIAIGMLPRGWLFGYPWNLVFWGLFWLISNYRTSIHLSPVAEAYCCQTRKNFFSTLFVLTLVFKYDSFRYKKEYRHLNYILIFQFREKRITNLKNSSLTSYECCLRNFYF